MGVFDLTGSTFLMVYGGLFVVTVLIGFVLGEWLRPDGRPGEAQGADELAYLAGGPLRLTEAVVTHLMAEHELDLTDRGELRIRPTPTRRSPAERRVLALSSPAKWSEAVAALKDEGEALRARLEERGLMTDAATHLQYRVLVTLPYAALLVFGAIKWQVGTMRDRPVGFLTAALVVTAICALIRFATAGPLTRAGQTALFDARRFATRMRSAHTRDEAGMAVALFGTAVLAGSALSGFHQMRSQSSSSGDSSSDSSGGDGGCGGGGCGGCGG